MDVIKQSKGRKLGSKNKEVKTLDQLISKSDIRGMMLSGFILDNNKIRITIATEISPTAALLYETILSHRNLKSNRCFPTINVLHKESGISERKISDLLKQLSTKGYIIIISGGSHYANQFYFPFEYFFNTFDNDLISIYAKATNQQDLDYQDLIEQIENKKEFFQGKAYEKTVKKVEKVILENNNDDEEEW